MNASIRLSFLSALLAGFLLLSFFGERQIDILELHIPGAWLAIPGGLLVFIGVFAFLWWMMGNDF